MDFDKVIIGAGLYGLYAAWFCARRGQDVIVLEKEDTAFSRATFANQARVHMGYHYPRSLSTAVKSAGYFRRFVEDYRFCVHERFRQIYATSARFSWTDAREFRKFCRDADIPCTEVPVANYFQEGMCDGAFLTEEYTYDAGILRDYFLEQLKSFPHVRIVYGADVREIAPEGGLYRVRAVLPGTEGGRGKEEEYGAPFVLNATYAAVNHVLGKVKGAPPERFGLKYELCEIILCDVGGGLEDTGVTVMDGPFFSIMPFGKKNCHSLTSVTFTPHETDYGETPRFACAGKEGALCRPGTLGNCNLCPARPVSAWDYMAALAGKYMREDFTFSYRESLFAMKPILKASEIDDSRPTVIRKSTENPTLLSVLSGKINTVYDLDEFLQ